MTAEKGFWVRQYVKAENWIERRSRFTQALTITTIVLALVALAIGFIFISGFIIWKLLGVVGLIVGVIFVILFSLIYSELGNAL